MVPLSHPYMTTSQVGFSRGSVVKNKQTNKKHLPVQEMRVRYLGREDPLEKEMVAHSSILAWRIPWMEKPVRLQSMGSQELDMT